MPLGRRIRHSEIRFAPPPDIISRLHHDRMSGSVRDFLGVAHGGFNRRLVPALVQIHARSLPLRVCRISGVLSASVKDSPKVSFRFHVA